MAKQEHADRERSKTRAAEKLVLTIRRRTAAGYPWSTNDSRRQGRTIPTNFNPGKISNGSFSEGKGSDSRREPDCGSQLVPQSGCELGTYETTASIHSSRRLIGRPDCSGSNEPCGVCSTTRRHARIRGHRGTGQLRLPRQYVLRVSSPGSAALLDLAEVRSGQLPANRRRPGAILDRVARPADLYLQIAAERAVPRRVETDLRGCQGELRAHRASAGGR